MAHLRNSKSKYRSAADEMVEGRVMIQSFTWSVPAINEPNPTHVCLDWSDKQEESHL